MGFFLLHSLCMTCEFNVAPHVSFRASKRALQHVLDDPTVGGCAVAQYWLLLLHLKKKDLPAAQVEQPYSTPAGLSRNCCVAWVVTD